MQLKAPLYAQIEVTYGCNWKCEHCLNDPRHAISQGQTKLVSPKVEGISPDQFRRIAERIDEWEVFTATITGGEPLVTPENTFVALDELTKRRIPVDMNSNLALADHETMKRLLDRGLRGVLTSIHSHNPEVHDRRVKKAGSLADTVRGIQIVRSIDPNFHICANMVLNKFNVRDVYQTAKFVADIGCNLFTVAPLTPSRTGVALQLPTVVSEEEMTRALYDLLRVNEETGLPVRILQGLPHCFLHQDSRFERFLTVGCDAGYGYVTINPFGDVKPCAQIPDRYGNVLRDDLNQIWNNLQDYHDGSMLPEECEGCDVKQTCGGGCRAEAERRTGTTLKAPHPFMKSPIKKLKEKRQIDITRLIGKTFETRRDVRFRQEAPNLYTVSSPYKEYAFLSEAEMDALRSMVGKPVTVDERLARNPTFANFLYQVENARLLREVA